MTKLLNDEYYFKDSDDFKKIEFIEDNRIRFNSEETQNIDVFCDIFDQIGWNNCIFVFKYSKIERMIIKENAPKIVKIFKLPRFSTGILINDDLTLVYK